MFDDLAGRPIEKGDIIAYTASAGQAVSSINLGKVTRYTAKSMWVQPLNPDFSVTMKDDGYRQGTGKFYEQADWEKARGYAPREITEFIKTGEVELSETIINSPRPHRFYILKKI